MWRREPRWGRVEETYGEDPYLVSRLGIAAVRGFQGDKNFRDKRHLLATLKHFVGHGQPESGMNLRSGECLHACVAGRRSFTPFREALREAGAVTLMASYNEIDGVPSHANKWLLRDLLRKELGLSRDLWFRITTPSGSLVTGRTRTATSSPKTRREIVRARSEGGRQHRVARFRTATCIWWSW